MSLEPFLIRHLNDGDILGLEWLDVEKKLLKCPWKHAGKMSYTANKDAKLYKAYAINNTHFTEGRGMKEDHVAWKALFRNAMHKSGRLFKRVPELDQKNMYRVYQYRGDRPIAKAHGSSRMHDSRACQQSSVVSSTSQSRPGLARQSPPGPSISPSSRSLPGPDSSPLSQCPPSPDSSPSLQSPPGPDSSPSSRSPPESASSPSSSTASQHRPSSNISQDSLNSTHIGTHTLYEPSASILLQNSKLPCTLSGTQMTSFVDKAHAVLGTVNSLSNGNENIYVIQNNISLSNDLPTIPNCIIMNENQTVTLSNISSACNEPTTENQTVTLSNISSACNEPTTENQTVTLSNISSVCNEPTTAQCSTCIPETPESSMACNMTSDTGVSNWMNMTASGTEDSSEMELESFEPETTLQKLTQMKFSNEHNSKLGLVAHRIQVPKVTYSGMAVDIGNNNYEKAVTILPETVEHCQHIGSQQCNVLCLPPPDNYVASERKLLETLDLLQRLHGVDVECEHGSLFITNNTKKLQIFCSSKFCELTKLDYGTKTKVFDISDFLTSLFASHQHERPSCEVYLSIGKKWMVDKSPPGRARILITLSSVFAVTYLQYVSDTSTTSGNFSEDMKAALPNT